MQTAFSTYSIAAFRTLMLGPSRFRTLTIVASRSHSVATTWRILAQTRPVFS